MAGIYIHIPFCKKACTYCDFHFSTTFESYRSALITAMVKEISDRANYLPTQELQSLYFGGGTPSLLYQEELTLLFEAINKSFTFTPNAEITLEANPDDITDAKCLIWKNAGINRLSIGVQSFLAKDIQWMNRAHTPIEAVRSLELAKKYGFHISLDLMYGLPNTSSEDWLYNLQKALSFQPEHISAYCLTIEEKTVLSNWVKKKKIIPANEDEQSEQFNQLVELLKANGFVQYEISNFARDGHFAVHNSNYWKGVHYLGVGPSAHSFNGVSRQWNKANNTAYIKAIEGKQPHFEIEKLTPSDQFNEYLLTGLRTIWGVNETQLAKAHPYTDSFIRQLNTYIKEQKIIRHDGTIYLTDQGKLLADRIASELFI